MGGGQQGSATSQSTFQPSAQGQSALNSYLQALQNQIFQGGNPAGGLNPMPPGLQQQVAPMTAGQRAAITGINQTTPGAANLTGLGASTVGSFASGAQQNNPYLNSMYNQAATQLTNQYTNATQPGMVAQGEQTGSLGGTGNQNAQQQAQYGLGQGLGTLGANIYEPAYAQGQQLQLQAAQGAPAAAMGMFAPYAAQYGAGSATQAQNQNVLNTGYSNAVTAAQYPYAQLSEYGSGVGMALGAGGTTNAMQPIVGGTKL